MCRCLRQVLLSRVFHLRLRAAAVRPAGCPGSDLVVSQPERRTALPAALAARSDPLALLLFLPQGTQVLLLVLQWQNRRSDQQSLAIGYKRSLPIQVPRAQSEQERSKTATAKTGLASHSVYSRKRPVAQRRNSAAALAFRRHVYRSRPECRPLSSEGLVEPAPLAALLRLHDQLGLSQDCEIVVPARAMSVEHDWSVVEH